MVGCSLSNWMGVYKYFSHSRRHSTHYLPLSQGEGSAKQRGNACVCMASFGGEKRREVME